MGEITDPNRIQILKADEDDPNSIKVEEIPRCAEKQHGLEKSSLKKIDQVTIIHITKIN